MAKTATEIVEQALTLIDEQVVDILDAASTEMSLTDMGLAVLPQVARDLIKELPFELKQYLGVSAVLVEEALTAGEVQTVPKKTKVAFVAPSDFWELVSIKLPTWSNPVTDYILIDSREYEEQNNPFTRGGKQNPVVAVTPRIGSTGYRIECFSIASGESKVPDTFYYISFDNVPDDEGTNWPDELFDEITKALASELHVIKERLQEGTMRGDDVLTKLEQHE